MLDAVKEQNRIYNQRQGMYNRNFDRYTAPFSNAEYEMVILHPDHFLPAGSAIAMHTKDPADASRLVAKLYMIAGDGALREGIESTSPRFPAFSTSDSRAIEHRVNPLLVVLNADMAFRRFKRLNPLPTLCPEYQELVDLTQSLADEIYHAPVVEIAARIYRDSMGGGAPGSEHEHGDQDEQMDMDDTDEFGVGAGANDDDKGQDDTIKPGRRGGRAGGKRMAAKHSRFGGEINDPGADASYEETRDFFRYIMSGRDHPLDRQDEATLHSIGLHPEAEDSDDEACSTASGGQDEDDGHGRPPVGLVGAQVQGFVEKVSNWQNSSVMV